jgi:hypothetical protein
MKIETLQVLEAKADDGGHAVNIRVSPDIPVKIVTLVFGKSTSGKQMNELVHTLDSLKLREITVTTT